jgi:hypothetical protein
MLSRDDFEGSTVWKTIDSEIGIKREHSSHMLFFRRGYQLGIGEVHRHLSVLEFSQAAVHWSRALAEREW